MGAAVLLTYFLVAHPPASKVPVTMQVVTTKAFIFWNVTQDTSNRHANVPKSLLFNYIYRPTGHLSGAQPCKLYVNRPVSTGQRCPKPEIGRRGDPQTWRWFLRSRESA